MASLENNECVSWRYFLRQLLVTSAAWNCYFMLGLSMGAPTVFIPQIRREANSTDAVSEDMASWLPAIFSYCGIPWIFILSALTTIIGRKIPHIVVSVSTFAGFATFQLSTTVTHIVISEILQGILTASYMTTSIIIIAEYTATKQRGLFLTIKGACFYWGILTSNLIGTFFHWKRIATLGLVCSIYNLLTVFYCPESPYWLAVKGRFDECTKSHRWLKGSDEESENELRRLINTHSDPKCIIELRKNCKNHLNGVFKVISEVGFYRPILFSTLLTSLYMFCGKIICTIYSIDIIKRITKSESTAYTAMLILDAVTVLSMYVGCVLSRYFKRRSMLLATASVSVLFLLIISIYLYLVKSSIITENKYVSILLLTGFSISLGCGPLVLCNTITGELIPLENRGVSLCTIALVFKIMYSVFIKVAPYYFKTFGLDGTFFSFAVSSAVCVILIYKYLPETKDKTLQEIGDCMKGGGVKSEDFYYEGNELIAINKDGVTNTKVKIQPR